jgi:hypothetical protein
MTTLLPPNSSVLFSSGMVVFGHCHGAGFGFMPTTSAGLEAKLTA